MLDRWRHVARLRLRSLLHRGDVERELDDELRDHVERQVAANVARGMRPDDARTAALRDFGGVEYHKEFARDTRGLERIETLLRDLRHALRIAARGPAFTLTVVLSLALGIGAATTVFNLTWNVMLAPLPVRAPGELVQLSRDFGDHPEDQFSWNEFAALARTPGPFRLAATRGASAVGVTVGDRRQSINLQFVDGQYFSMLGLAPRFGRLIGGGDDSVRSQVVVLSSDFARRMFDTDSAAIGRTVKIRGAPFQVIGVTPRSWHGTDFPGWFTAAIPISASMALGGPGAGQDNGGATYGVDDDRRGDRRLFEVVGRVTGDRRAVQGALGLVLSRCCVQPRHARGLLLEDIQRGRSGGKNDIRGDAGLTLTILMGGVTLVLVVVCCNIAGLLLVRSSARRREIAVRMSLGAPRRRIVLQLVAENAVLAIAGGVLGLVFAVLATAAFARGLPDDWDTLAYLAAMNDWGMIAGVVLLMTGFSTAAFAVYPALHATRVTLAGALRLEARASRTRGQGSVARTVVALQVALAVVLLTAARFGATWRNLYRVDGGFETDGMLLASLEARSTPFERGGMLPIQDAILRNVAAVPFVRIISMATSVPLHGGMNTWSTVVVPSGDRRDASTVDVTPGHLAAMGIRLLAGRDFLASDAGGSEPVAIVSEEFARRAFLGRDPIGVSVRGLRSDSTETTRIIGVAGNARYESLRDDQRPTIYLAMAQTPSQRSSELVVRTPDPSRIQPAVLRAIEAAAPGLNVRRVRDMQSQKDDSLLMERLAAKLGVFISVMALVLSAVGLYGVVAYNVSRRVNEIGIRLALGARTGAIVWLVVKETAAMVVIGALLGLPLAYAGSSALRSQLYGVGAHDPRAVLVAVLLLACAGLTASVLPARRAARVDPRIALSAD